MNEQAVRDIREMVARATIDYRQEYMLLFAAYNAWFRGVTGAAVERRALQQLKQRGEIWGDILHGRVAPGLRSHILRLYVLTQHRPLSGTRHWNGSLKDAGDWEGLLEFWYAVRCDVVHGTPALRAHYYPVYVKMAYETLLLFMIEITRRLSLASVSTAIEMPPLHRLDVASHVRIV